MRNAIVSSQLRRLRPRHSHVHACAASLARSSSTGSTKQDGVKTGVVFMNMGGPSEPEETGAFLKRLFADSDIIDLGFKGPVRDWIGQMIATRRTPKVQEQYAEIGGSPIRRWTEHQAERVCRQLDERRPESAPHKPYVAFRYADPLTETALQQMASDGVEHAVAFSQFPQWSCTTAGSSMNELWRDVRRLGLERTFKWSIIDRWPLHPGFIAAVTERVEQALLQQFDESVRDKVVLVFSAHSIPMKVVEKGDQYTPEVAASVKAVMARLSERVEQKQLPGLTRAPQHILAWQSKVGPLPWMVPSTEAVIKQYGKSGGSKALLLVPIAFTSDHIETLYEIGIEYKEEAEEAGIHHVRPTSYYLYYFYIASSYPSPDQCLSLTVHLCVASLATRRG